MGEVPVNDLVQTGLMAGILWRMGAHNVKLRWIEGVVRSMANRLRKLEEAVKEIKHAT